MRAEGTVETQSSVPFAVSRAIDPTEERWHARSKADVRAPSAPVGRFQRGPGTAPPKSARDGRQRRSADPCTASSRRSRFPRPRPARGRTPPSAARRRALFWRILPAAALAACQETTLRMVAANMGIDLEKLEVRSRATGTAWHAGDPQGVPVSSPHCGPTRASWCGGTSPGSSRSDLRNAEKTASSSTPRGGGAGRVHLHAGERVARSLASGRAGPTRPCVRAAGSRARSGGPP